MTATPTDAELEARRRARIETEAWHRHLRATRRNQEKTR